jgi:hypothetical protein
LEFGFESLDFEAPAFEDLEETIAVVDCLGEALLDVVGGWW